MNYLLLLAGTIYKLSFPTIWKDNSDISTYSMGFDMTHPAHRKTLFHILCGIFMNLDDDDTVPLKDNKTLRTQYAETHYRSN